MSTMIHRMCSTAAVAVTLSISGTAVADDPVPHIDGAPVTLTGEVADATPNTFTLDYGEGLILVEMDDWDSVPDGVAINEGERVRVSGRVDQDFFETQKLEAGTVYVFDRNTFYAASTDDEETAATLYVHDVTPPAGTWVDLSGWVESVDDREFIINTGGQMLTVDTIEMGYNPLDDIGLQQIDTGDYVSVYGEIESSLFGEQEIHAESVTSYDASS